jgi:hypothetical protein
MIIGGTENSTKQKKRLILVGLLCPGLAEVPRGNLLAPEF